MLQILQYLKARTANSERGAAAVEYGLLVALIAAVIALSVGGLGDAVKTTFENVTKSIGG